MHGRAVTTAQWPPRRGPPGAPGPAPGPDIEALTGLRSGKPHYYPEYRISAERLHRVIHALERISAALVRTMEGSEALVRAVVEAAADHLSAEWVVFALVDGELPDAAPAAPGARPGRRRADRPATTCRPRSGGTWTQVPPRHRQRRARRRTPAAGTCTCRSGSTAGWSAASIAWTPAGAGDRRHRPLGAAHPGRSDRGRPAELRAARPLGPAARAHHPAGRRPEGAQRRAAAHPGRAGRGPAARGARRRAAPDRPRAARQRHPVRAVGRDAHRAGPLRDRRRAAARASWARPRT